ncbi:testis anion transporter 1 isoform X7 [Grus americana]|uniref:testis anion transporter 1 isoform X7 n=1 Tax=Grus americana TaxID=9117 RepID=UPI002408402E|nr:testis anion transporter 1 isoform X7 [Grus americana]
MTQYGSGTAASRENYLAGRGLSLWGLQRGAFRGWESPGINLLRCKRVLLTRVVLRFCEITSINDPVPSSLTAKKLWSPAFGVPLFLTDCDQKENTALDNDTVGNYKQPSAYRVQREMQTEEHFQAYFERKLSSTLGGALQIPRENRRLQCSFSWGRFRKITLKVFPVLNWLFSYRFREWILRDLHAGLSVGMVQIPQGLLGVWLTRLPVPNINGFLSAFCCSMTYVIFGTSHHISVGSFSILNVVGTNILKTLNFNQTLSSNGSLENFSDSTFMKDYVEVLTLTASITFLTGIIQLLLGCFCLGFVTTYVPKTLIDAYLTAAALHVIVSQFTFIFDIMLDFHKGPLGIFYNLFHFFLALPKANATSILLFLLSMAALRVNTSIMITYKHSPIAFPMELLLIITVTIISNRIHLHAESSSAVVSMIPQRFLPPTPPDLSNLSKIILHAFSLAIVSYFLLVFVGERYASPHNYHIASNQELIAVGLCNICSSFFKSFVVSCAISGTVIQEKTGGRTQLAAAIGASLMLVIALKLGHFFQMIPNAREIEGIKIFQCCSSISFANVNHFKTYLLHEMDVKAVPLAESEVRAFVSFSLSDTSVERKDLKCSCVCDPPLPPPRIPYTEKLVKQHHADSDSSSSSVNLVHWSKYGDKLSSRTFLVGAANASSGFNTGLTTEKKEGERRRGCLSPISPIDNSSVQLDQEEQPMHLPCPVHTIILDFSMVQFVDLIGSELMRQIIHMFQNIGITVLIAGCHSSVIADFEKNDFFDSCVTKERFFLTLHDAVLAALDKHQKPDEVELTAKESAEEPPAEQQKGGSLLLKKNKDFFSAKTSDNKLLREEPISDTSFSAQNKAEPSSLQQYDAPPLQMDFQDPGWGKRWKYTSKS